MRFSNYYVYLLFALAGLLLLASCSDSGGDKPDPDPTKYTKTFNPQDTKTKETLKAAVTYNDESGTKLGTGRFSLKREDGTKLTLRTEADGYTAKQMTVSFNESDPVTIPMSKDTPETVTITLDLTLGGSAYESAVIYNDDTDEKIAEGAVIDIPENINTKLPIRIEGPDIKTTTKTLVFDKTKTVKVALEKSAPKTVTLSITPEIAKFTAAPRGESSTRDSYSEYKLTVGEKTFTNVGPDGSRLNEGKAVTIEYPAGSKAITVSGRFIYYKQSEAPNYYSRSLALGELTLTPAEDKTATLTLDSQLACSDGINNDPTLDDVADENDSGCVDGFGSRDPASDDFVYDKDDDNEVLKYVQTGGALISSQTVTVSSKKGNREDVLVGRVNFARSAKFAVGEMPIYLKNKIEKKQTDETFALIFTCGPKGGNVTTYTDPHTTDIVPDDQSVDGWRRSTVHGMTRAYLTDGLDCLVKAVHGSKVRGEAPGNGNDDVFFYSTEKDGSITFKWFYEPEEVDAGH